MDEAIIKMFGSFSSSQDSIATIDLPNDGKINGLYMTLAPVGMDALNDVCRAEVSFLSTNSFASNDTRGSLCTVQSAQNFLTSGGGVATAEANMFGLQIPVNAGERLHLHGTLSAGVTGNVYVYLFFEATRLGRPARRRR